MASTADIAGALAFVPVSFGIAFERSKPVVIKRNRGIDSGESRRILAASFYIELVVETFFSEIALFISDPIIEPAMRLNYKFRHIAVSPAINSIARLGSLETVGIASSTASLQNERRVLQQNQDRSIGVTNDSESKPVAPGTHPPDSVRRDRIDAAPHRCWTVL